MSNEEEEPRIAHSFRNNDVGSMFHEVFQDTSSGDVGIEIAGGPLLRVHSLVILQNCPGFLTKIRNEATKLNTSVTEVVPVTSVLEECFKNPKYYRFKKDMDFAIFSQDPECSCLNLPQEKATSKLKRPGYTTATHMSGSTGSFRNRDVFALAERYEVPVSMEYMIELLRHIYLKEMEFFDFEPETPEAKSELIKDMLAMLFLSDEYAVDELVTDILEYMKNCIQIAGEASFVEAYFRMEYYARERCKDPTNISQFKSLLLQCFTDRVQLRAITRDSRWMSFSLEKVEEILSLPKLAIGAEEEILGLLERWNANADKSKTDLCRLLACYRADKNNCSALNQAYQNLGYQNPKPEFDKDKKPRENLTQKETSEILKEFEAQKKEQMEQKKKELGEALFFQYEDGVKIHKGFWFPLQQKQTIVQNVPIRLPGIYRIRIGLSQTRDAVWDPSHELFCGVIFGNNRYFGYVCMQSPYTGVFRLQSFSSSAPKAGSIVNLTGSGTKVEFDLELGVSMQRVDKVVTCTLSIESDNTTLIACPFQVHRRTLLQRSGLRFQILGSIPPPGIVDVSLAWVGGG